MDAETHPFAIDIAEEAPEELIGIDENPSEVTAIKVHSLIVLTSAIFNVVRKSYS
jgi:hypothetical protein